jgi:hypothetical protein
MGDRDMSKYGPHDDVLESVTQPSCYSTVAVHGVTVFAHPEHPGTWLVEVEFEDGSAINAILAAVVDRRIGTIADAMLGGQPLAEEA